MLVHQSFLRLFNVTRSRLIQFVEPSGVQGSACTRQPKDTLEQSGDTALEYGGMWQRHAIRSCTCGVCLCKSAHSLAPVFTGTTVCVSCLLNRSKSVRNEGEALIHCSSNTISVRLRLCSKFLAAKCLSYFLTDEPSRTIPHPIGGRHGRAH